MWSKSQATAGASLTAKGAANVAAAISALESARRASAPCTTELVSALYACARSRGVGLRGWGVGRAVVTLVESGVDCSASTTGGVTLDFFCFCLVA